MQLTEENLSRVMIGGISIFLPSVQEEAESCIAGAATTEEQSPLMMTVEEELEQTLKSAQVEIEEENEHSVEWLNAFSTEAEKNATEELTVANEEETDNICFVICGNRLKPWRKG
jgi:hypothetical protein